jgi:AcrR family transcriptional regulator
MRLRPAGFVRDPASHRSGPSWARPRIQRAVIDLAREQGMGGISVRSICVRAGVGRHTFFQVFGSLDEARVVALRRQDPNSRRG